VDLDLGDLELRAEDDLESELKQQMECVAGEIHLHNPDSGEQGVV
tara:strand:- start:75 stop:209 length:135 start_codon:yes stop_codon:yes gene_type:complete